MIKINDETFSIGVDKFLKMCKNNESYSEIIINYGNLLKRQSYNNLSRIQIFEKLIYPEILKIKELK